MKDCPPRSGATDSINCDGSLLACGMQLRRPQPDKILSHGGSSSKGLKKAAGREALGVNLGGSWNRMCPAFCLATRAWFAPYSTADSDER